MIHFIRNYIIKVNLQRTILQCSFFMPLLNVIKSRSINCRSQTCIYICSKSYMIVQHSFKALPEYRGTNSRATQQCNMSLIFMQLTGQSNCRTASSAFLLARKGNCLARTCINMRNVTCVGTQTSKVLTRVVFLFIFCSVTLLSVFLGAHCNYTYVAHRYIPVIIMSNYSSFIIYSCFLLVKQVSRDSEKISLSRGGPNFLFTG